MKTSIPRTFIACVVIALGLPLAAMGNTSIEKTAAIGTAPEITPAATVIDAQTSMTEIAWAQIASDPSLLLAQDLMIGGKSVNVVVYSKHTETETIQMLTGYRLASTEAKIETEKRLGGALTQRIDEAAKTFGVESVMFTFVEREKPTQTASAPATSSPTSG